MHRQNAFEEGSTADADFPVLTPPPDSDMAGASVDRSSGVLTVTCPHCGARNTFPEFDDVDIFVCDGCQERVRSSTDCNERSATHSILKINNTINSSIVTSDDRPELPILAGAATPDNRRPVGKFFISIPEIFETLLARRKSPHTQRGYREDFIAYVRFLQTAWPDKAAAILSATVTDAQAFRDQLIAENKAPKTINRCISSVSSFYQYRGAAAAELRLPIIVPNPAHAQFIPWQSSNPVDETRTLSAVPVRQLINLPQRARASSPTATVGDIYRVL